MKSNETIELIGDIAVALVVGGAFGVTMWNLVHNKPLSALVAVCVAWIARRV